jgi:uncharacterized protein (DUF1810 family)
MPRADNQIVPDRLDRFKSAQDGAHSGFAAALHEIEAGRKSGHWIWYIFPQLSGLGSSAASQLYAIDGEAEATAYLRDPLLRSRLLTITRAVAHQLTTGHKIAALMGSRIDAHKLVSSLTLFGWIAANLQATGDQDEYRALAAAAETVLAAAAAEGFPRCGFTLAALKA